ncbi:hypothetical protein EJB05_12454, partial [Eragrostis curvula]
MSPHHSPQPRGRGGEGKASPVSSGAPPLPDLAVHSLSNHAARLPRQEKRRAQSKMPATPTIIGALLGLGTQMYSNALRKLPYMRHPWEHVLGMGLGAVFVNQLVKFDDKLKEDLDKMLERAKQANERRYFGLCLFPLTF